MITVNIDGKELKLERPVTILEAAAKLGIKIPTLCFEKGLEAFGGCRLCLVEVERVPRLTTACTVNVTDGMVVKTKTERVLKARKAQLEFLLINHPLDCPVCDKAGECELQDLVAQWGPSKSRFAERKQRHPENLDDPLIVRNMERCVTCTRCVRMCNDVQGAFAIAVMGRGSHSYIEPFSGGRYDCEYCGNCLTVCPVGALMSRLHRHSYRPWYVEKDAKTICGFCGVGCTLFVQSRGDSVIRAIPRQGEGVNGGILCVRGRFGYDYRNSEKRLKKPLAKIEKGLEETDWDTAFDYSSKRILDIKEKYGPGSIAGIASGRCTNEDNYMLQKLLRYVIGSNNIDSTARFYFAPAQNYIEKVFEQGATANLIPGIINSDGIIVSGGDPTTVNPVLGIQCRRAKKNGAKVIVIGKAEGLNRFVDFNIDCKIGYEELVFLEIARSLVEKVELKGENAYLENKLKKVIQEAGNDYKIESINQELVGLAVSSMLKMKSPSFIIGPDLIQTRKTSLKLFLFLSISYVLNGRVFLLSEKPNYQGLLDMGCSPDLIPGGMPIDMELVENKIEGLLGVKTPQEKGLDIFGIIDATIEGKIKGLIIMGDNPLINYPDREKIEKALSNLELLIVQEPYYTETAKKADVVFPTKTWIEKNGTFSNLGRRLQKLNSNLQINDVLDDWKIVSEISNRMGMSQSYSDTGQIWEEINKVATLFNSVDYAELGGAGILWPYFGQPVIVKNNEYSVESLDTVEEYLKIENSNYESPVYLLLERSLYHSGTLSSNSEALLNIYKEPCVKMNKTVASKYGVMEGQIVKVILEKGSIEGAVKIDESIKENNIYFSNIFENMSMMGCVGYEVDTILGSLIVKNNEVIDVVANDSVKR